MRRLRTEGLGVVFGGLHAVEDVTMDVGDDEIVGLIGPNGAGKTTVFNLLTNVYIPTSGSIELMGKATAGEKTYQVARHGIARTFQNIRLFSDMTVLDNVKLAMNNQMKYSVFSAMLRLPSYWKEEKRVTERAMELLGVFDLAENAHDLARNLPYGKQRKLEITRALAMEPSVLLLDEPAAGMNPTETMELMQTIRTVKENFRISVLLIEHDMNFVMGICQRIFVLDYGKVIAVGTPEEIQNNPQVVAAYLGA
ncbi:MAG: ABC transporter ATP-binding protein [Clostridiales bacterium]|nr:ABC transporter ATP-binding protein [Clostridiales bacterium]